MQIEPQATVGAPPRRRQGFKHRPGRHPAPFLPRHWFFPPLQLHPLRYSSPQRRRLDLDGSAAFYTPASPSCCRSCCLRLTGDPAAGDHVHELLLPSGHNSEPLMPSTSTPSSCRCSPSDLEVRPQHLESCRCSWRSGLEGEASDLEAEGWASELGELGGLVLLLPTAGAPAGAAGVRVAELLPPAFTTPAAHRPSLSLMFSGRRRVYSSPGSLTWFLDAFEHEMIVLQVKRQGVDIAPSPTD